MMISISPLFSVSTCLLKIVLICRECFRDHVNLSDICTKISITSVKFVRLKMNHVTRTLISTKLNTTVLV